MSKEILLISQPRALLTGSFWNVSPSAELYAAHIEKEKVMELDKRQWYVRWFFWSLMIWDEFWDTSESYSYKSGTNLCHFMRATLLWTPLILLLHIAMYGAAIAILTVVPVALFGGATYAWIAGTFAFIAGLVVVIKLVTARMKEVKRYETTSDRGELVVREMPRRPGFFKVLWIYIVAAKKKVCPMITFNEHKGAL